MPRYPFILLGLLLVGITFIPPFIGAVIDMQKEARLSKTLKGKEDTDGKRQF